jgi:hypothetical protein
MATINSTTPFVNPMLNNVVNPFANVTPFGTANPFVTQQTVPSVSPFAYGNGLNGGTISPIGIVPNQSLGNAPFATAFSGINTPFGIQNVPGLTPWNVNPMGCGVNPLIAGTIPFGVSPTIGGFIPSIPFGGVSPIANNIATQSQLPWQLLNGIQSAIHVGNVSTPWQSHINSFNPIATQLPTWLNALVNQSMGCSPIGACVNPWGSTNVGSPIITPFGNGINTGWNSLGGISPWQTMGGSFGQPIGFGAGNCASPYGCCL